MGTVNSKVVDILEDCERLNGLHFIKMQLNSKRTRIPLMTLYSIRFKDETEYENTNLEAVVGARV